MPSLAVDLLPRDVTVHVQSENGAIGMVSMALKFA